MLSLETVAKKLQDRRLDKVSKATGIHESTIRAIRDGTRTNVQLRTLEALSNYMEAQE